MQSNPKSNSIITTTATYDDMIDVTVKIPRKMAFTVLDTGVVETDLSKWSPVCLGTALVHGVNQRLPDGAAIGRTDKDGEIIPEPERRRIKYEKMNELAVHYESGTEEWNRKPSGGGEGSGKSLTIEAIARWKGIDYEAAEALVEKHAEIHKMDIKGALAFFRTGKKTKAAMQEIRDERAKAKGPEVDPDSLLEEIEGGETEN